MMNLNPKAIFISTKKFEEETKQNNHKILDLREYSKYEEGHIANSVFIDSSIFSWKNIEGYNEIPPKEIVEQTLRQAGINEDDYIYLIDDVFNLNCSLAAWTLHYYGISNISLIDGALQKWIYEGKKLTKKIPNIEPGNIKIKNSNEEIFISRDEIMLNIYNENYVFVDNRSEFSRTMDSQGGSIPGSKFYWWMDLFEEHPDFFVLKKEKKILDDLEQLDITKDKTVVLYCENAAQSALVYLVLKSIGYKHVRVYLAGYNEWRLCGGFV